MMGDTLPAYSISDDDYVEYYYASPRLTFSISSQDYSVRYF